MRHPCQHRLQGGGFLQVNRQPVLQLHRQHAAGEPALVVLRLPLGRVLGDLLVGVQPQGRQRQVIQVAPEAFAYLRAGRAESRVVRLGQSNDVLSIRLLVRELGPVVGRPPSADVLGNLLLLGGTAIVATDSFSAGSISCLSLAAWLTCVATTM